MACTFTIGFQGTPSRLVAVMKSKMENQGGTFSGNDVNGNFDISLLGSRVAGSYMITGQKMSIGISHKPFFISCDQIKNYVENTLVKDIIT